MTTPDPATLEKRARAMLVAMTRVERWIYALPRQEGTLSSTLDLLAGRGLLRREEAEDGEVVRLSDDADERRLVLRDEEALDAVLVEGSGPASVADLKAVLEAFGFVPQSQLWREAMAVEDAPLARRALRLVAHMMVEWNEDFFDLFILHLASPDAVVRRDAVVSVTLASLVARDVEPGIELLEETRRRERAPELTEAIEAALDVLRARAGQPVDAAALALDLTALSPGSGG